MKALQKEYQKCVLFVEDGMTTTYSQLIPLLRIKNFFNAGLFFLLVQLLSITTVTERQNKSNIALCICCCCQREKAVGKKTQVKYNSRLNSLTLIAVG